MPDFRAETVGKRGGRRLVDEPRHFEPGNFGGAFRFFALNVVKMRRHADNRLFDRLAQGRFGQNFDFFQNRRAHFGRAEAMIADDKPRHPVFGRNGRICQRRQKTLNIGRIEPLTEQPFRRMNRPLGLHGHLSFRHVTHVKLIFSVERHHRRKRRSPFFIENDLRLAVDNDCGASIRCSQINSDNRHDKLLSTAKPHPFPIAPERMICAKLSFRQKMKIIQCSAHVISFSASNEIIF